MARKLTWVIIGICCLLFGTDTQTEPVLTQSNEFVRMHPAHPYRIDFYDTHSMHNLHLGVVRVEATSCQKIDLNILGSAFAIAPHWLLTNKHVINNTQAIEIYSNEEHLLVKTETRNTWVTKQGDLALIYLPDAKLVTHFQGRETAPAINTPIIFIGYPGGWGFSLHKGKFLETGGTSWGSPYRSYRSSAHLLAGNSGGPLMDLQGRVLGIGYASDLDSGTSYAYPLSGIESLLQKDNFTRPQTCQPLKYYRAPNLLNAIYGPFYHPIYGPPLPKNFHLGKRSN